MRKQWLVSIVVLLAGVTMGGCGSNRSSDSVTVAPIPVANAEKTGNCSVCHTLGVHVVLNGIVGKNPNAVNGYASAITHDCENCHGGGQYHHGEGPIPYPSPDATRCATCHAQAIKVLASKHNAEDPTNVAMIAGGHDTGYCQRCHTAEGSVTFKAVVGEKATLSSTIVANGAVVGVGQVEALPNLDADGNHVLHNIVCGACHNALTKELLTVDAAWDPNRNGSSDQFDLCTSCHNYQLNDGTIFGSGSVVSGTAQFIHETAWYRIIPSTHYDDPTTLSGQGTENGTTIINKVEGYVIRQNSANPCFDCHGHELKTNTRPRAAGDERGAPTIHTQWASSGHAQKILVQKRAAAAAFDPDTDGDGILLPENAPRSAAVVDAVQAAYASDGSSHGGYTHYDWDAADRQSCQMCHTSTGFVNYVSSPTTYNAVLNDFSHLSGWVPGGSSPQNEMLYCWGCHSNAETGVLRVAGAVTATYTYDANGDGTQDPIVFPDVGRSNTCVVCHSGRGNNTPVSTSSRFAGHHAPAAADLFSEDSHVAYEYPGLSYANVSYFGHIGIDVNGSGPCVACHMNASASHTFAVVEKDVAGVITAINADVCVTCHDGEHTLFVGQGMVGKTAAIWNGTAAVPTVITQAMVDAAAATLEEESEGYQDAGQLLNALVVNTIPNYLAHDLTATWDHDNDPLTADVAFYTTDPAGATGAFQNAKLPIDEPGGFAHNRYYVKRALFDAIDWMEDGVSDGTIADYSAGYPAAMAWLGTSRPGGM